MISYEQVFNEIERQLQQARQTNNVNEMREALAAIRSLSTVALGGSSEKSVVPQKIETSQVVAQPQVQSLSSIESTPLVEADGSNGDSLFDF